AALESAREGQDAEQDGHRTTKSDPCHECGFVPIETEWQHAEPDGNRPGEKCQDQRDTDCGQDDGRKLRGCCEQAQCEEHRDLGEPCQSTLEPAQGGLLADTGIAGDKACDVYREEAA